MAYERNIMDNNLNLVVNKVEINNCPLLVIIGLVSEG